MALTTLPSVKLYIGVDADDTTDDPQLEALRQAAERIVKQRCNRDLESANYIEYYSGTGKRELILRQRPVTAVASVYDDKAGYYSHGTGTFDSTALLTDGVDYVLDWDSPTASASKSGVLLRINGVWGEMYRGYQPGRLTPEAGPVLGNVKVTYTAGYTTIPDDLQYAVAYLVAAMRRMAPVGGDLVYERIGEYQYELGDRNARFPAPPVLGSVDQILAKYREFPLGII